MSFAKEDVMSYEEKVAKTPKGVRRYRGCVETR